MTMTSANCTAPIRNTVSPRVSVFSMLSQTYAVWRQRQTLKSLDTAALRDIGVSPSQAKAEADRPIWDAPASWLR